MLKINKGKDVKKSTFILICALLIVLISINFLYFGNKYLGSLFEGGTPGTSETTQAVAPDYEYTVSDSGAVLTKYNGQAFDLVLPAKFEDKPLIGIGDGAFASNADLRSVVIPDTVTDIGADCFQDCVKLTQVKLPKSLKALGYSSFENSGLTAVTLTDSVKTVGDSAFYNCKDLVTITVSDSITALGAYAFDKTQWYEKAEEGLLVIGDILYGFKGDLPDSYTLKIPDGIRVIADASFAGRETLKSVVFSNDEEYIGIAAFAGCGHLKALTVPAGVVGIADEAFSSCAALETISFPASVTEIGVSLLVNCPKLQSVTVNENNKSFTTDGKALYNTDMTRLLAFCPMSGATFYKVSDKVTSIDSAVFYGVASLTSVTLPDTLTVLPEYIFYGCTGLTVVTIPDTVMTVSDMAFYGCTSLSKVQMPTSLHTLGDRVFYGCTALKSLVMRGSGTYKTSDGILFSSDMKSLTVYPCAKKAQKYTVPETVLTIGDSAFLGAANLTEIVLPDGLTTIAAGAFAECARLLSVAIPDTVVDLGNNCFSNCKSLVSVQIGKLVSTVGDGVFNGCYALKRFVVSAENKNYSTQNGVLYDASKTTLLNYPAHRAAKDFIVPETVTAINAAAFYSCIYLESIRFGAAVTTLYPESFIDCQVLQTFSVDENNKTYTDKNGVLFKGNVELIKYPTAKKESSYTVPDTVKTIDDYAFERCKYLSDLTVGEKIEAIGADAFYDITGFTLYCPEGSAAQAYAEDNGVEYKLIK